MKKFINAVSRMWPYFWATHNVVRLLAVIGYLTFKEFAGASSGMNIIFITLTMVVGRILRSSNSENAISNTMTLLVFGSLIDAYFAFEQISAYCVLGAVFATSWILVESDRSYRGKASRVELIGTLTEWKAQVSSVNAFVFFFDPSSVACTEYSSVHAELSCRCSGTNFFAVDLSEAGEVAKEAKIHFRGQPVVVLYKNGKEVSRLPTDSTRNRPDVTFSNLTGLDRTFWYEAVKTRLSL